MSKIHLLFISSFARSLSGGSNLSMDRHLRDFAIGSATRLAIMFSTLLIIGCSSNPPKYHWASGHDALDYYHSYLTGLRQVGSTSMEDIANDISEWQVMEDSVIVCIKRDTLSLKQAHYYPFDDLRQMHNTARNEFLNRAKAQSRTLSDILTLKLSVCNFSLDPKMAAAANAVAPFFRSLDSIAVYNDDAATIVQRYRRYLQEAERKGIYTFDDIQAFMKEEDRLFRSFMNHLSQMSGISVSDITKKTNCIYERTLRQLASGNVGADTLSVLLTMRANRRLIINAEACLADIKGGKVKSPAEQEAYSWMILQPFLSIDELGMAVLSEEEKQRFYIIAKEAPAVIKSIENRLKKKESTIDRLPDLIIKVYISSL